jgi:membrane protease YdiL (CAAX protease family)
MIYDKKYAANKTILFVFIAFTLLSFVGGAVISFIEIDALSTAIIFSVLTQVVCMGVLPITLFHIFRKKSRADFSETVQIKGGIEPRKNRETFAEYISLSAPKGGAMRRIFGITVCAMIIAMVISTLTQLVLSLLPSGGQEVAEDLTGAEGVGGAEAILLSLILYCVFPAVFEELTFRGILLGAYKDSPTTGVFLSAAMFALMHMNIDQTFYTFFLGIVLAVLTLKSRSIIPAMILHFLNNAASYIISFLALLTSEPLVEQSAESAESIPAAENVSAIAEITAWLFLIGIAVVIVGFALYGLISGIKKINKNDPVDWSGKSGEPANGKARGAIAGAVVIGVIMTALTVLTRIL